MTKFVSFWKKAFRESSLLRNVIVMFTGVLIGILFSLPFGIDEVIEFVTSTIIVMVITQLSGDMWFKITREPEKLCWQYWVGSAGILAADWLFMWASKSTTFNSMFLRIGICVAVAIATIVFFELFYKKKMCKKFAESKEALKKLWRDNGLSDEIIEKTLQEMK